MLKALEDKKTQQFIFNPMVQIILLSFAHRTISPGQAIEKLEKVLEQLEQSGQLKGLGT